MNSKNLRIAVTPPAFCKSKALREEVTRHFPNTDFNDKNRYLTPPELVDFLQDKDAAIIGRDTIGPSELQSLSSLRIISKYGVGLDNIDEEALKKSNVALGWTPGVNKRSVAELTLCFMLGLFHNVFSTGIHLKNGQWRKEGGKELSEKKIGIMGCGNVGREVIRLLKPFKTEIMVTDILDIADFCKENEIQNTSFENIVDSADIISLHIPLTKITKNLISTNIFERMKSTAFLINTSRGEVVDQPALKKALKTKQIAGAALDVFNPEPPDDIELLSLENLTGTPHIGGNAHEAVEAMGNSAINHLIQFFNSN